MQTSGMIDEIKIHWNKSPRKKEMRGRRCHYFYRDYKDFKLFSTIDCQNKSQKPENCLSTIRELIKIFLQ